MSEDLKARSWATVSAIASAASAITAMLTLVFFGLLNARNDERADRQDRRAEQQESRLERQEMRQDRLQDQQYASKVYIGEAPQYFYREFDGRPGVGEIVWVVVNASGTQLWDVWIEGRDGEEATAINIDGIQRCTLYSAPVGFEPVGVHFKDPNGAWFRPVDAGLAREEPQPMPSEDDGNSPYTMDVQDCSG